MSVSVTFNGVAYSIPEDGETGWSALTDYLVALSNAAVATALKTSVRTVTVTPSTAQATDCVLLCGSGASVINLPTGIKGQFYAIYDKQGTAQASPLTVNPAGGDTIAGAASYTIKTNRGGVLLQYADSANVWQVIAEIKDIAAELPRVSTDGTNASFVRGAVVPESTAFVSVQDGEACTADFTGSKAIHVVVGVDDEHLYLVTDYAGSVITALSDRANLLLEADAGVGIYVSKSASDNTLTFKNRTGGSKVIEIRAMTNQLSNITGWA
jgi:hypothetical protein